MSFYLGLKMTLTAADFHPPRFNRWVTAGCAFFALFVLVSAIMFEESTNPAMLELFNQKTVSFYNGYILAPRWQQLVTGVVTAEQIKEDINYYNDFSSLVDFKQLRDQITRSDKNIANGHAFTKAFYLGLIQALIFSISILLVFLFHSRIKPIKHHKSISYLELWPQKLLAAALLRLFAGLTLVPLLFGVTPFLYTLAMVLATFATTKMLIKCFFPCWASFVKFVKFDDRFLLTPECWFYVGVGNLLLIPAMGFVKLIEQYTGRLEIADILNPLFLSGNGIITITQFAMFCVAAPISEEIVFRGFIFTALRRKIGILSAGFVSSLMFSALHFYSWSGFVTIFLVGLILTYVFERSKSLWPAVIIHATNNYFFMMSI